MANFFVEAKREGLPECHVQGSRAPSRHYPLGYQPDQCGLRCTLSCLLIWIATRSGFVLEREKREPKTYTKTSGACLR